MDIEVAKKSIKKYLEEEAPSLTLSDSSLTEGAEFLMYNNLSIEDFDGYWMSYIFLNKPQAYDDTLFRAFIKNAQTEYKKSNAFKLSKQSKNTITAKKLSSLSSPIKREYKSPEPKKKTMNGFDTNKLYTPSKTPRKLHELSPTTFPSPIISPQKSSYNQRTDKNTLQKEYIGNSIKQKQFSQFKDTIPVVISDQLGVQKSYRYMFNSLMDSSSILEKHINKMKQLYRENMNITFSHLNEIYTEKVYICGRIYIDTDSDKQKQLLLEGSIEDSDGKRIHIDVSHISTYLIYSGQVVVIEGTNPTGNIFVATSIYDGITSPCPSSSPSHDLSIITAIGPFTTNDNIDFDPLNDLFELCLAETPNLLILCGPFISRDNQVIKLGNIEYQGQDLNYVELFVCKIISEIRQLLASHDLQFFPHIVLIPAGNDAVGPQVYPQPPIYINYRDYIDSTDFKSTCLSHMSFCSNPCLLSLDSLSICINNTDILYALINEGIDKLPPQHNRMAIYCESILKQRHVYPLLPPIDESLEITQYPSLYLPETPHLFIVPSRLATFINPIGDCLAINPGTLTKSKAGGTFVKINVYKHDASEKFIDNVKVEIRKI
ncbi:hypothetical protein WA158_007109 [Blastocystis sp. Blastoise]